MNTNSYHDYLTCLNVIKIDVSSAVLTLDLFATWASFGVISCMNSLIASEILHNRSVSTI